MRQEVERERLLLCIEGVTEDEVVDVLVIVDRWCHSHNPAKRYRYDFEIGYVTDDKLRPLGYGERHISYFQDEEFLAVTAEFIELCHYLVLLFPGAYVKFNKPELVGSRKASAQPYQDLSERLPRSGRLGVESNVVSA